MFKKIFNKLKNKPDIKNLEKKAMFHSLYKDIFGEVLSKKDRGRVIKDDCSLIYGEICFDSFEELLRVAGANSDEVFYDLGSGTGKAVIVAALTQSFVKCVGVEILPSLYSTSIQCLNSLNGTYKNIIHFIQGNFYDVDISEADIIFINATGFFGESFAQLSQKLETAKSKARIIITSKTLTNDHFELMHQGFYRMSWGHARVSIYRKL